MAQEKLREFVVTKTPKIRDSEGNYVKRGETCKLNKALAEHYQKLGYIRVGLGDLYDDKNDPSTGPSDEGKTGSDGGNDAGANPAEESPKPTALGAGARVSRRTA